MLPASAIYAAVLSALVGGLYSGFWRQSTPAGSSKDDSERWSCRPFLPTVFAESPPEPDHPALRKGAQAVDAFFTNRFAKGDIDSLSVAIVTSDGPLYEKNFGTTRGNESNGPPTTSHSMYRIASVSKLFTVLEGLVLEQKGIIAWDDPVDKYLKDFKFRSDGLAPHDGAVPNAPPITLFQLATHMSGLGRDWPPGVVKDWPHSMQGGGPPPTNGHPFPSHQALYDAIAKHHLTSPPWYYPAYSNTGTGVLGLALAAASRAAAGAHAPPLTYADLLARDLFVPMGLNGSHFLTTEANKHLVVVPSVGPEVADQDFLDAMNPAGGQFSSLADAITVVQTLLNPSHPKSQISSFLRDKWLQTTVHAFEEDDWTEIGLIWEIIKARDSYGRLRKIYWKLGAMAGYHTAIAIHPGTSYGVVVLMGGKYADAAKLAYDTFELFQPAVDQALSDAASELYVGHWTNESLKAGGDLATSAQITIERGTLYVERFMLFGVDALRAFQFGGEGRLALRQSGWRDELRIDTGIPGYNGQKHMGCYPYWNGQDFWGVRENAAINAFYFTGKGSTRRLHIPSLDVVLSRTN
ncbi:beta-lactamase/transpeptidase-like protein [Cubamyces sp. BRFM 1775]|nr:beta-lactamase/transpeptidase-like protein [Cubamyces sp. BRFM 1775]